MTDILATASSNLSDIEIYIGNSQNYQDNALCPDGPHLSDGYGDEIWCNLAGQYVSIVKDVSGMSDYDITICELDIMGEDAHAPITITKNV